MIRSFAVMAVAAVFLATAADAAVASVAVQGLAPLEEGGFQLQQTTVRYGDLNIASKQGASTLLARIRKAAAASCTVDSALSDMMAGRIKQCRDQAVSQAVATVDSPELTTMASAQ